MAAAVFNLNGKARARPHPVNRRRVDSNDGSLGNGIAESHCLADQRINGQLLRRTLRPVIHHDKNDAAVGFLSACQNSETDNFHGILYARLLLQPTADLTDYFFRFILRRSLGQGDINHGKTVVFRRYEPRRDPGKEQPRQRADKDEKGNADL